MAEARSARRHCWGKELICSASSSAACKAVVATWTQSTQWKQMCSVHMLGNVSIPNTANTQRSRTYCISMCFNAATGPSRHFAPSPTWKHWKTSRSAIWKRNYTSWWHTLICLSTWWSATSSLSSDVKLELSDHPSERQLWEEVFPKRIS